MNEHLFLESAFSVVSIVFSIAFCNSVKMELFERFHFLHSLFHFSLFFFLLNMLFQEDTKALLCICINIIADLDLFSCTVKKKEPKTLALISQILNIDTLKYLWIMILLLFITVFFKTVLLKKHANPSHYFTPMWLIFS